MFTRRGFFPWRVIFFIFGSEILNSCPFIVESIFMRTTYGIAAT
nr:MAG TPA: hypothetical protein [Caudoviricetes sp.]DAM97269.1 MAG TPA: hypothetical protein [Caudoviricetes sp.]DAZ50464.1 MAG TPA: hypothetical protein [Caudoviricetes sp.]